MMIQEQEASRELSGLWIVVKVESGIPVTVEAFPERETAQAREKALRKDMYLESDETGIFEIVV